VALIVQKYGGTAVADLGRIRQVARPALRTQRAGHQVVVVVSAMAEETSRLLGLAAALGPRPDQREQDVVAAAGGQVAAGLAALAVQAEGGRARSLTGPQARLLADGAHARARIRSVEAEGLRRALGRGEIAVVSGVQGEDEQGNVTTLGPGGADAAAVAFAAALGAQACEIDADAGGVYTADPAVKISTVVQERYMEQPVRELHRGFGLDAPPEG
jgi:aspartate kinase